MRHFGQSLLIWSLAAAGAIALGGCGESEPPKASPPPPRYPTLPARENLPAFMKGTIYEYADVENKAPYVVSAYGLVVNLAGTGNNNGTPLTVRNAIADEMTKRGLGSKQDELDMNPGVVLRDPRTAIVEVYGLIPPGARKGQRVDLLVQTVAGSQTTSLARGVLYTTDLRVGGADPLNPNRNVNIYMKGRGAVFVNPAYVTAGGDERAGATNLRAGIVMGGGLLVDDRPLWLRARTPQLSLTRSIEQRIDLYFQETEAARTRDEGYVWAFVPQKFGGDWDHYIKLCTHLYFDSTAENVVTKGRLLAEEAVKPGALLSDISYCFEGLGEGALPFMRPLFAHPTPEIAFAAARAGAYIGDTAAADAVHHMAQADKHPFQLNAVKVLADLPASPRTERMLTELLSTSNALVRIEAYKILSERSAPAVASKQVRELFVLDEVLCDGPPLVYVTRSGVPRIALFGRKLSLKPPVTFTAMGDKLAISVQGDTAVLFDRTDDRVLGGRQARVRPELFDVVYRLGGGAGDGFEFGYSDLVGILQGLSRQDRIAATLVMQDPPLLQDAIEDAPPIPEQTAGVVGRQESKPADERVIGK